ncbi:MAG: hypothetical protein HDR11_10855 [Lachnospiraceae bacterium]|nr:hypothetical protein [Lachnospiraceae bacterium]
MDGIKRNLLYWGYTIGLTLSMILAMVLGICIVTGLDESGNILFAFCATMDEYGGMYMPFFMGMLGMVTINNYLPFTLSMGSTRRDSFIGMEIMLHLEGLLLIGIIIAAGIFSGRTANGMFFFGRVLLLVVSAALCNLSGWAYQQFGKAVSLILFLVLTIMGGLGASVFAAMHEAGKWSLPQWGQLAFVAAAVAADCVVIYLYAGKVKKLEVRV